jgi:hypothetical protein
MENENQSETELENELAEAMMKVAFKWFLIIAEIFVFAYLIMEELR